MITHVALQPLTPPVLSLPWATGYSNLDSQADLWLYRVTHPENALLSELVLTPYPRSQWQDLWSIKLINRDEPGILTRVATFLKEHDINIASFRSCTLDQGKYHASRLAIDCRAYKSGTDRDHAFRSSRANATLNQLRREMTLALLEELRFFNPRYPSIYVERVLPLWRLHHDLMRTSNPAPQGVRVTASEGKIAIPHRELEWISTTRSKSTGRRRRNRDGLQALVSFDEYNDVIRVLPFYPDTGIVPIAVSTDNRPGAVAMVSQCLSSEGLNILASAGWNAALEARTFIWLLVDTRPELPLSLTRSQLRESIAAQLRSSRDLLPFRPKLHAMTKGKG